jgi:predicted DNA-binding transcriptional regulator AlpA
LLDSRAVCAQVGGISLMTLWWLIKFRGFPAPDIQLGQRRRFWKLSTVTGWVEQQMAATTETREACIAHYKIDPQP